MKLITNTQITVDGVMQANGGRNATLDPGFDRGGWALPVGDEESTAYIGDFYLRADAFLFGRRTYDLFAGYWGVRDDLDNPFVRALNERPKYVASTTLTDPTWNNTEVLQGDLIEAVTALKAREGKDILQYGYGSVTAQLVAAGLVDEVRFWIHPVFQGGDSLTAPLPEDRTSFELISTKVMKSGVIIASYRPRVAA